MLDNRLNKESGRGLPKAMVASAVFAMTWVLLARFSSVLFVFDPTVEASGLVSVCALAAMLLGACVSPALSRALRSVKSWLAFNVVSCVAAVLVSVTPHVVRAIGATCELSWAVIGLLYGFALLGYAVDAVALIVRIGWRGVLRLAATVLPLALACYAAIGCLVPGRWGFLIALLPLLSCCSLAVWFDGRPETQGCVSFGSMFKPVDASESSRALFRVLLFFTGCLTAFMPVMHPKTTNLAPFFLEQGTYFGQVGWSCVAAIALLAILLSVLNVVFNRRKAGVTLLVAAVLVLFAAMFFFLPSMSTSALPFVLIMPFSVVLMLLVVVLLVERSKANEKGMLFGLREGFTVMVAGGLSAGIFAYAFLGPLYNVSVFQDALFSSIPAILLIVVLILIFCFRNDCTRLVPPKTVSDAGQGDEGAKSSVSIRCSQISEKHGLTRRETEVLVLLAEGRNEPYIEDVLGISRTTVKTHITHIYRKVGVSSRQGLLDVLWE